MAKSQITSSKKENEKRKLEKRKEKEQRREERKANARDGNNLDEMIAYVDEFGNISSTPPDLTKKRAIKEEEIEIGSRNKEGARTNTTRKGKVTFFNTSKGYGFIKDLQTQESIFVHVNSLSSPIKENDLVSFETERGPKGLNAVNVKPAS
jgi:cold shock CspA family protein